MLVALGLLMAACADGDPGTVEIDVATAASLGDAFTDIAAAFEAQHPAIQVDLNVASSSQLREQILADSGQDVFASASVEIMRQVESAGVIDGSPTVFARNTVALLVPEANPAGIDELSDLEEPSLLVGLCAASVPCGQLARDLLESRNVEASVDTNEPNARALRTKVETGELDAALLYASDAVGNPLVDVIDLEPPVPVNNYPIAVIAGSVHADAARLFVDFVLSSRGQDILTEHGFLSP